mgnify:CR=1 FL=1
MRFKAYVTPRNALFALLALIALPFGIAYAPARAPGDLLASRYTVAGYVRTVDLTHQRTRVRATRAKANRTRFVRAARQSRRIDRPRTYAHQKAHPRAPRTTRTTSYVMKYNAKVSAYEPTGRAVPPHVALALRFKGYTASMLGLPRSLWCGDFIRLIAEKAGFRKPKNPRMARDWALVGAPSNGKPGDLAIFRRGRSATAGHVGIVSGTCKRGIMLVSGNFNNRVAESCYPRARLIAFRSV